MGFRQTAVNNPKSRFANFAVMVLGVVGGRMGMKPKKRNNDIGVMWCGWGLGVKSGKPPSSPLTNHICSEIKA